MLPLSESRTPSDETSVMSPAVAGQVLTLTPIVGFLLSTVIFGGAITADIVGGILLIAIGLVLTLRR